jgi:hypothetical protein
MWVEGVAGGRWRGRRGSFCSCGAGPAEVRRTRTPAKLLFSLVRSRPFGSDLLFPLLTDVGRSISLNGRCEGARHAVPCERQGTGSQSLRYSTLLYDSLRLPLSPLRSSPFPVHRAAPSEPHLAADDDERGRAPALLHGPAPLRRPRQCRAGCRRWRQVGTAGAAGHRFLP